MTTDETPRPSPGALWMQAGDEHPDDLSARSERYRELLREHGHLVTRKPGEESNLPCGWPSRQPDGTAHG